ncbi:hypothetical protein F1188_15995 [Roseospira marina]|uniref:Uncharacterized protein n=1 Tax=Roseospira marina TaxID=140057 RepID=A0A5M6I884_9PROT|nr:hypothetical protein [Roseospira marina]KAA5604362.1 hypothetical protein F1188_15995 [Roseospira marina]MBB4315452.1 hypothetical protein [Roseospira marina]MBB5088402.1 hypothetical protein [Roseospira marina]
MGDLFTVRMERKRIIYTYDDKGARVGERVEMIQETYAGLPFVTAQGYKERHPDANVIVTKAERNDRSRVRVGASAASRHQKPNSRTDRPAASRHQKPNSRTDRPAASRPASVDGGSYADAINAEMRAMEKRA